MEQYQSFQQLRINIRNLKNLQMVYNNILHLMNNANCYALENKDKYLYDSEVQEQYEFRGSNIVRTQKSMSAMSANQDKSFKQNNQMKKSNSFLLYNKQQKLAKNIQDSKDKSKAASKKCLNITEARKKPPINSKNSMNKTSVSIGSVSGKSTAKSKKRSISRDYLMLDEEIYQCDNIQQINQKLICGNNQFYSHQRFVKITLKNQQKLQTYLTSFSQYIKYNRKNQINVKQLSEFEKKKLYLLLKTQAKTNQNISKIKTQKQKLNMQSLIKEAVQKIQNKTDQIIIERPSQQVQITKWKNAKLHQLMIIHTCLSSQDNSDRLIDVNSQFKQPVDFASPNIKTQSSQRKQKLKLKLQNMIQDKNTLDILFKKRPFELTLNLSRQSFEADREAMPNKPAHLEKQIIKLNFPNCLSQDTYPNQIKNIENFKQQLGRHLPDDHYLSVTGIQSFLHNLWNYLVDADLISQFIQKLRYSFGLNEYDKRSLMKFGTQTGKQWTAYMLIKSSPILRNEIFIQFCQSMTDSSDQLSEEARKYLLILQKAIFDNFNVQLSKFQTDFPYGAFHPLENNLNNSAYLIDQENAMQVWQECIKNTLCSNEIGLGSLADSQVQQNQKTIKNHNQKAFSKYLSSQNQLYTWQRTLPLANRFIFQKLINHIQSQLFEQFEDEIRNF